MVTTKKEPGAKFIVPCNIESTHLDETGVTAVDTGPCMTSVEGVKYASGRKLFNHAHVNVTN